MNQKKVPARKGEPKTYTYTFNLPQLAGLGGGLAAALTVFFILGLLIGRGYRPETEVPELARIMPAPQPVNATAALEPQVLKPEELHYMEQLTQTTGGARIKADKAETKPEAEAKTDKARAEEKAKAIEAVRAEVKAEAGRKPEDKKPAAAPAKPEKAPAKAADGGQVFDYVYQAAAFKERGPAEDLRRRIEGTGLKTGLETATEKGVTWHRVTVLYRGTPESTDAMRQKLFSLGLGRPIMKSKQPAR